MYAIQEKLRGDFFGCCEEVLGHAFVWTEDCTTRLTEIIIIFLR